MATKTPSAITPSATSSVPPQGLTLDNFFPYQLTQLQADISDCIADLYTGKFDLTRHEWRVLAILGSSIEMSAKQIGLLSNLEKMQASRAISKMLSEKLLVKTTDVNDKRSALLKLTPRGLSVYQQLVPMALTREQELLSVLSLDEKQQLIKSMNKLSLKSRSILEKKP
jgi:DNA-binding MarR family transcriptional regulator